MRFFTSFIILILLNSSGLSQSIVTVVENNNKAGFRSLYVVGKSQNLYDRSISHPKSAIALSDNWIHENFSHKNKVNVFYPSVFKNSTRLHSSTIYTLHNEKKFNLMHNYALEILKIKKSYEKLSTSKLKYFQLLIKRNCSLFEEIIKNRKAVNMT